MKSIAHSALARAATPSGCWTRWGRRRWARRGRLSFMALSTRYTRLWFHRWPSRRRRWSHSQNPQRGWCATTPFSASLTSRSLRTVPRPGRVPTRARKLYGSTGAGLAQSPLGHQVVRGFALRRWPQSFFAINAFRASFSRASSAYIRLY